MNRFDNPEIKAKLTSKLYGKPQGESERVDHFIIEKLSLANRLIPGCPEEVVLKLITELVAPHMRAYLRGISVQSAEQLIQLCSGIEADLKYVKNIPKGNSNSPRIDRITDQTNNNSWPEASVAQPTNQNFSMNSSCGFENNPRNYNNNYNNPPRDRFVNPNIPRPISNQNSNMGNTNSSSNQNSNFRSFDRNSNTGTQQQRCTVGGETPLMQNIRPQLNLIKESESPVETDSIDIEESFDDEVLVSLGENDNYGRCLPRIPVTINGQTVQALVDTGASVNFIRPDLLGGKNLTALPNPTVFLGCSSSVIICKNSILFR
ncbi:hypothetical protein JTB14_028291 [Gonioctena quinquepunctata]|nr:hypothetical protein JTB14_028291 [Gonioctena quinquepunctata]